MSLTAAISHWDYSLPSATKSGQHPSGGEFFQDARGYASIDPALVMGEGLLEASQDWIDQGFGGAPNQHGEYTSLDYEERPFDSRASFTSSEVTSADSVPSSPPSPLSPYSEYLSPSPIITHASPSFLESTASPNMYEELLAATHTLKEITSLDLSTTSEWRFNGEAGASSTSDVPYVLPPTHSVFQHYQPTSSDESSTVSSAAPSPYPSPHFTPSMLDRRASTSSIPSLQMQSCSLGSPSSNGSLPLRRPSSSRKNSGLLRLRPRTSPGEMGHPGLDLNMMGSSRGTFSHGKSPSMDLDQSSGEKDLAATYSQQEQSYFPSPSHWQTSFELSSTSLPHSPLPYPTTGLSTAMEFNYSPGWINPYPVTLEGEQPHYTDLSLPPHPLHHFQPSSPTRPRSAPGGFVPPPLDYSRRFSVDTLHYSAASSQYPYHHQQHHSGGTPSLSNALLPFQIAQGQIHHRPRSLKRAYSSTSNGIEEESPPTPSSHDDLPSSSSSTSTPSNSSRSTSPKRRSPPTPLEIPSLTPLPPAPLPPIEPPRTRPLSKKATAAAAAQARRVAKNAVRPGMTFVNYSARDAEILLGGVAPSGSSKRRRREREAAEKAAEEEADRLRSTTIDEL